MVWPLWNSGTSSGCRCKSSAAKAASCSGNVSGVGLGRWTDSPHHGGVAQGVVPVSGVDDAEGRGGNERDGKPKRNMTENGMILRKHTEPSSP